MSELKYLDGTGVRYLWQKFLTKVRSLYDNKLDNVVAKDASIDVEGNNKVGVQLSSDAGNIVNLKQDGLYAKTADSYQIERTQDEYNNIIYHLKRIPYGQAQGSDAGNQIVIPADSSLMSGHIVEKASEGEWGPAGTYIELTNKKLEKTYIAVGTTSLNDVTDTITQGSNAVPTSAAVVDYVENTAKYNVGAGLSYEQNTNTIGANLLTKTKLRNTAGLTGEVSGRTYPVYLDSNGKLAVNIPWTDSMPVRSVSGKVGIVTLSKGDVGLGNVDNTSDADKPISSAAQAALNAKLDAVVKGANNGVAELDENGKVPASQLPSYVDDVVEYPSRSYFPATGESGKIYISLDDYQTYRWSGSTYVELVSSLALGVTSSTAFRGDYGNIAYQHALNKGSAFESGLYKIATNAEGHVVSATPATKEDIVSLGFSTEIHIEDADVLGEPLTIEAGQGIRFNYTNGTLVISLDQSTP